MTEKESGFVSGDLIAIDRGGCGFVLLDKKTGMIVKVQLIQTEEQIERCKKETRTQILISSHMKKKNADRPIPWIPLLYHNNLQDRIPNNIVTALNSNLEEESPPFTNRYQCFMTKMTYIPGETLKYALFERHARQQILELSPVDLKVIFFQIAVLLHQLETTFGLVHGDIKLQNLMITRLKALRGENNARICEYLLNNPHRNDSLIGWKTPPTEFLVSLLDFGSASTSLTPEQMYFSHLETPNDTEESFSYRSLTLSYACPDVLFSSPNSNILQNTNVKVGIRQDTWSFGVCMLFCCFSDWENNYGFSADIWSSGEVIRGQPVPSLWAIPWLISYENRSSLYIEIIELLCNNFTEGWSPQYEETSTQGLTDESTLLFITGQDRMVLYSILSIYLLNVLTFGNEVFTGNLPKGSLAGRIIRVIGSSPLILESLDCLLVRKDSGKVSKLGFFSVLLRERIVKKLGISGFNLLKRLLSTDFCLFVDGDPLDYSSREGFYDILKDPYFSDEFGIYKPRNYSSKKNSARDDPFLTEILSSLQSSTPSDVLKLNKEYHVSH